MPLNRNSLLRHQVIDQCLRNRLRKWTWHDILEKVNEAIMEDNPNSSGISRTLIFKDFRDIQNIYKGEIKKIKKGKLAYYTYADPNYSINNQPLSDIEASHLRAAVMVLTRFKGLPQFEWINEIIPLLQLKMGLVKIEEEVITFENNVDYTGLKNIPVLFNAIVYKRVLSITYQNFRNDQAYDLQLHPYHLKQYNSRWFLFGLNPEHPDKIQTIALDRVLATEELSSKFIDSTINWVDYFEEMIGVTRLDSPSVVIKLLITDKEQAAYIRTKPLHVSQKDPKKVENGYETSINVVPNYELESLLLSFGERIQIISPEFLRKKLYTRVQQLYALYLNS